MYKHSPIALAVTLWLCAQAACHADDTLPAMESATAIPVNPQPATTETTPEPPPLPPENAAGVTFLPAATEDLIARLRELDRKLLRNPDDAEARAQRLLTLSRLGATDLAITESASVPNLAPQVLAHLYEDKAEMLVRWSENTYHQKSGSEYSDYDAAIAQAQENLQRFPQSRRSRFVLVRALNGRNRRAEAIDIYTALLTETQDIPTEVHASAGDAYLATKQPELGEQAFRRALLLQPDNFNANFGLFYALSEQRKFAAARMQLAVLSAHAILPEQQSVAATSNGLEPAYEGQLNIAQQRLTALLENAPDSDELNVALGRVYLWRGWPRRAQQQFNLAAQRDPDNLHAQIALVQADAARNDWPQADDRLTQLQTVIPDDKEVLDLARARQLNQADELSVSLSGTRSNENVSGGRGIIVDSKLLGTALIPALPQVRPFIHEYFERDLDQGLQSDYRRLGAGVQYTLPGLGTINAEVQQEFFLHPKTSASLSGNFNLSDQWSVRAQLDSDSIEVPLVARYYGIGGWLAGAGVTYRANDRWWISADVNQVDMNDSNTRRFSTLAGSLGMVQGPFYQGRVELEWDHMSNSLNNVLYFSPHSSDAVLLSYLSDWNTYQRYEKSFDQRLVLSIGRQTQQGYPDGTIGGISYEHRISVNDAIAVNYGLGYVRRFYDGAPSSGPEIHLQLNWKFL